MGLLIVAAFLISAAALAQDEFKNPASSRSERQVAI
jgi:hypothetical protein